MEKKEKKRRIENQQNYGQVQRLEFGKMKYVEMH